MASGSSKASGANSGRLRLAADTDRAVDHDMTDVNALRREFTDHALRQALAKGELAHRERCQLRVALDAGKYRRQDGPVASSQHSLGRALRRVEPAHSAVASDGLRNGSSIERGKHAADLVLGLNMTTSGVSPSWFFVNSNRRHRGWVGRIAGDRRAPSSRQGFESLGLARGHHYPHASLALEGAPQAGAQPRRRRQSRRFDKERHAGAFHMVLMPPSTMSSLPTVKDDSSDARNTMALAISTGSPKRPSGTCDWMCAAIP